MAFLAAHWMQLYLFGFVVFSLVGYSVEPDPDHKLAMAMLTGFFWPLAAVLFLVLAVLFVFDW